MRTVGDPRDSPASDSRFLPPQVLQSAVAASPDAVERIVDEILDLKKISPDVNLQ